MTTMNKDNFNKYNSIENSYREGFIDRVKSAGYANIPYILLEKIHGTNTQLYYDGKDFKIGSRNHFLEDHENHYGARELLEPLKESIKKIYDNIIKDPDCQDLEAVILFGEVFGGSYPDMKDNKATKVQKGVFYCPHNAFLAFDIALKNKNREYHSYLDWDAFQSVTKHYGIPTVPVITSAANLDEALSVSNTFNSVVPKMFNLPELSENIAEGLVIRGRFEDHMVGQHRLIIKNKSEKFSEVSKEKKVVVDPMAELSDEHKDILNSMISYVTENRLRNVLSHIPEVTIKQIGEVIKAFNLDILEDFSKDDTRIHNLSKQELKPLQKQLNFHVVKLVKELMYKEY